MSLKSLPSLIILNGSTKGINNFKSCLPFHIEEGFPYHTQVKVRTNTTEEELYNLKKEYPDIISYYFYEASKMKGQKSYDSDCPNMSLYDDFINITHSKQ